MNVSGIYELFEKIGRNNQWIGFLVGLTIGAGLIGVALYKLLPSYWREKLKALDGECKYLRDEEFRSKEGLEAATKERDAIRDQNVALDHQVKVAANETKKHAADMKRLLVELGKTRGELERSDAKVASVEGELGSIRADFQSRLDQGVRMRWDQPVAEGAPRFEPLHVRRMSVISLINLKGGVGKTTLTASLAVTLAKFGMRVLVIDLDYQGSLTSLVLSGQEFEDAQVSHRMAQEVIRNGTTDRPRAVFKNASRLESLEIGSAYLLAANDGLDETETEILASWLLGQATDDVRLRLRAALHSPLVWDEYDIVLIDCPPRLSTACVNALAASDYVLIPVIPEPISAEATPRLLNWIKRFRGSCCPELSVLGLVANRVRFHGDKPVKAQADSWSNLKDLARKAWGPELRCFDEAIVKQFGTSLSHEIAAMTFEGEPVMRDLALNMFKELSHHARRPAAAVPPVAYSSAGGVGG